MFRNAVRDALGTLTFADLMSIDLKHSERYAVFPEVTKHIREVV